jgi:hypothetical protein
MYLEFAEPQANRGVPMQMKDWIEKLDSFVVLNDRELLKNAGKVAASLEKELAEIEFKKYRIVQDRLFEPDFDQLIERSRNYYQLVPKKKSLFN